MVEQLELHLRAERHEVRDAHEVQQLAAVRLEPEELLVSEDAVRELAAAHGAVAERGPPGEHRVDGAQLALVEEEGVGRAEQPAVDPHARVESDDLAADLAELGGLLANAVEVGERAGGPSVGLGSCHIAVRRCRETAVLLGHGERVAVRPSGGGGEDAKLNEGGERLLVTVVALDDGADVVGGDGVLAQADEPARDSPRVAALLRGQPLAKKLCERDHRGLLLLREFLCHGTSRANEASV